MFRSFLFPLLFASMAALPAQTHGGWQNLGHGLAGSAGIPVLGASSPQTGQPLDLSLSSARPASLAYFVLGLGRLDLQVLGGTLVPMIHVALPTVTDRTGSASARLLIPRDPSFIGAPLYAQVVVFDPQGPSGVALSAALGNTIDAGPPGFHPPQLVGQITGELNGIEAGLVDGDGHDDIVVGAVTVDEIRVFMGSGNGAFQPSHTWAMGDGPTDVALGDFDGDGQIDVLATNFHANRVRIRWGHSNLGSWSFFSTGAGPWRVRSGDLDLDGRDDFVTTNLGDDNVTVRLSLQGGGFSSTNYSAGDGNNDVQLGDVDGDGYLDIAYTKGIHNAVIEVRLNDGSGGFGPAISVPMGSGFQVHFLSFALGDFDGNGDLDIVAMRNTHELVRALGNGNGVFQSHVVSPVLPNPLRVYMHDMNLDGNLDLVVAHIDQGVSIYVGDGIGNAIGPYQFITPATFSVRDVDAADFNEDGRPDLALSCSGGVYVLLAN